MPITKDANGQILIPVGEPAIWNFAATVRVGRGTLNVDPVTVNDFETSWTANLGGQTFSGGSNQFGPGFHYQYFAVTGNGAAVVYTVLVQDEDPTWLLTVTIPVQAYIVIDPLSGAVTGYLQRATGTITAGINGTTVSFPALTPGFTVPFNALPSIEFFSGSDWTVSVQACGPDGAPTIGVMPLAVTSNAMYGREVFTSTTDGRSGHRSVTTWDSDPFLGFGTNPAATGWSVLFQNRFDAVGGLQVTESGSNDTAPWPAGALLCYGFTDASLAIASRSWPDGDPISGMPTQAFNLGNLQPSLSAVDEFTRASVLTDSDGSVPAQPFYSRARGTYDLSPFYIATGAWNRDAHLEVYGADSYNWTPGTPSWLQGNNYDPRTAGAGQVSAVFAGYGVGLDVDALIDFHAWDTLITVTRQSSMTFEGGQGAALWQGVSVPGDVYSVPTVDPAWQITQQAGGIHALYPAPASPAATYGLQQAIASPGLRRAWRNYRYCQIKINASAACKVRFVLQTSKDILTDALGQPLPWPTVTEYWDHITLAAGDNTITLDLAQGIRPPDGGTSPRVNGSWDAPSVKLGDAHAGIGGSAVTTGVFDGLGECVLRSYTTPVAQDANNRWARNDVHFARLDGLTPGITYTLQSITLLDRSDGERTPLRVLGDLNPNASSAQYIASQGAPPRALLRVLANGRPAAVFPVPTLETPPGGSVQLVPSAADFAARLIDYFDGGANVWSVDVSDADLAAAIPACMLQIVPGSVTDTGFALAPVARIGTPDKLATPLGGLTVSPWFEIMMTESPEASWNLGGIIEGLVLDASLRTATSGAQVAATMTNPPRAVGALAPITTPEGPVTTDDDGYFALALHQPVYVGPPYTVSVPTVTPVDHSVDDVADPDNAHVQATAGHRNTLFLYILAVPALQGLETDMAQDYVSGRIYFVHSDANQDLSCDVYEGYSGLAGMAARSQTIADSVSGLPRQGIAPSLWIVSEAGTASLAYQRVSDSAVVMAYSQDGLITIGAETMSLFSRTGGLPHHYRDGATGIAYVFAAFPAASGASHADVLLARLDASNTLLTWADGTTEKTVVSNVAAAGRPDALPNRVDGAHTILLLYGDLRYQSADGGETWTAIS